MTEGRDEAASGSYQWPDSPAPVAPAPEAGKLVTWSGFAGFGQQGGFLAWIGGQRIGTVQVERNGTGAEWFCSLPCDDASIDMEGSGSVDECKAALEACADGWAKTAGLMSVADAAVYVPDEI